MFALVQVPEHGDTVLATGSGQGTVGRDGEGVDVSSVSVVVGLELAFGQLPDLVVEGTTRRIRSVHADCQRGLGPRSGWESRKGDRQKVYCSSIGQRSWWIKMVSSGLFHPSEVANIYRVIMMTRACGW